MAAAAIYLASRAGDYVVGATIPVDGGVASRREQEDSSSPCPEPPFDLSRRTDTGSVPARAALLARFRWPLMIGGPLLILAIVAFFVLTGGKSESTDDAYVRIAQAPISAAIAGRVTEVDVAENQTSQGRAGPVPPRSRGRTGGSAAGAGGPGERAAAGRHPSRELRRAEAAAGFRRDDRGLCEKGSRSAGRAGHRGGRLAPAGGGGAPYRRPRHRPGRGGSAAGRRRPGQSGRGRRLRPTPSRRCSRLARRTRRRPASPCPTPRSWPPRTALSPASTSCRRAPTSTPAQTLFYRAVGRAVDRGQLQGRPAAQDEGRPAGDDRHRRPGRQGLRRPCPELQPRRRRGLLGACRRKTRPATGSRWCSGCPVRIAFDKAPPEVAGRAGMSRLR